MTANTMQDKRLRRWELALLLGALAAILLGSWLGHEQSLLADKVIRLHVVAHSDSAEDQALKLKVRDQILTEAEGFLTADCGLDAALRSIGEHIPRIKSAAEETVRQAGYDYPVAVSLEDTWFPTRQYTDFAFPAGNYTALRVVIGEGTGQNWWCVVFPPLCLSAVTETVAQTALEGGMSQQEISLITGESGGYVIKFKAIELWEELKKALP